MRPLACGCFVLMAAALSAQETPPVTRPVTTLSSQIDRAEFELRQRASALRRDAFIISQIVAATAALDDFQRNTAIQRGLDNIEAAWKRAGERPAAPRSTIELLESERDLLRKAKQQAAIADIPALKKDMLRLSRALQQVLFRELDDSRRDRQAISDLQSRLSRMTNDLDEALSEALGSTFDFFRAGGQ